MGGVFGAIIIAVLIIVVLFLVQRVRKKGGMPLTLPNGSVRRLMGSVPRFNLDHLNDNQRKRLYRTLGVLAIVALLFFVFLPRFQPEFTEAVTQSSLGWWIILSVLITAAIYVFGGGTYAAITGVILFAVMLGNADTGFSNLGASGSWDVDEECTPESRRCIFTLDSPTKTAELNMKRGFGYTSYCIRRVDVENDLLILRRNTRTSDWDIAAEFFAGESTPPVDGRKNIVTDFGRPQFLRFRSQSASEEVPQEVRIRFFTKEPDCESFWWG